MSRVVGRETVTLRMATMDDDRVVYAWANDSTARAASGSPAWIPWDTHARWFAQSIRDPRLRFWIIETNGAPVGYLRALLISEWIGDWTREVSIALAPMARGQGIATRALVLAASMEPYAGWRASIEPANMASRKAFLRAGYRLKPFNAVTRQLCYERGPAR